MCTCSSTHEARYVHALYQAAIPACVMKRLMTLDDSQYNFPSIKMCHKMRSRSLTLVSLAVAALIVQTTSAEADANIQGLISFGKLAADNVQLTKVCIRTTEN